VIARVWSGATRAEDAEAYAAYLARELDGTRRLVLRRVVGDRAQFTTVLLFDSPDDVHAFAGDELERAVFFPEDDRFLVERDFEVRHYEVDAQI
jgi:hypothetical protein